tara:strand:+ start:264 stop:1280 length:1017 start_codon:yes stop_codon:yes gene_type:complete
MSNGWVEKLKADQANKLVYGTSAMTLNEKRLLLLAICKLDMYMVTFPMMEFRVEDLAGYLDVKKQSIYSEIKAVCKRLLGRIVEIENEDDTVWIGHQWVSRCRIKRNQGKVEVQLHEDLKPYLLDLKARFQSINFTDISNLASAHALRIYEILWHKRLETGVPRTLFDPIDIDEFRRMLGIHEKKTYQNSNNLKKKILEPAMEQINEKTPLRISYDLLKGSGKGAPVKAIQFTVVERDNYIAEELPKVTLQMLLDLDDAPTDNKANRVVNEAFIKNLDRDIYDPKYERWIKAEKRTSAEIDKSIAWARNEIKKKAKTSRPVERVTGFVIWAIENRKGL